MDDRDTQVVTSQPLPPSRKRIVSWDEKHAPTTVTLLPPVAGPLARVSEDMVGAPW